MQRADDVARDVVGLLADLGHRGGLVEVAAAQRADGVQRDRRREHAEDAAVVGGVDAESRRAGADQAGAGERGEERVLDRRGDRARAVDDGGHGDLGAVAEADGHVTGAVGRAGAGDGAGVPLPAAGLGDVGQPAGGHGRHPVPADLPAPGVVLEEDPAVVLGQPAPQLGGDGPQPVDGGAPVAGLLDGARDVGVDGVPQLVERGEPGDAGRRRDRRRGRQHVVAGHQVVTRHRVQGAARPVGGDRDVDHGQAGADEEQVAVGELLGPGVRDQAAGRDQVRRRPVDAGLGAGREDHRAGHDRAALVEADDEPVAAPVDAEDPGLAAYEPGVGGVLGGGAQQALDVLAVHAARHEVLGLGLAVVVLAHPAVEVVGVAREGAHAAGGDVQQVAVVGGGVRRAAPGRRAGIDQLDAEPRRQPRDQVGGGQRAAGAGADHHHTAVTFATAHHAHPSMSTDPGDLR